MKGRNTRVARWATLGLLVASLCVVAAGCGGSDDGEGEHGDRRARRDTGGDPGAGTEEGEVNLVQWPDYAALTDEFNAATGCKVNTKNARAPTT